MCCRSVARKVPQNYILLLVFTLCESYLVAFICSMYTAVSVIVAAGLTAGMTIALTLYAMMTKRDFTMYGGIITVISFSIMALIMIGIFIPFPAWWHPVLACVLITLYGIFLVYDT